MNFKNKTVVITGASSGIGKALALRMIDEGADLWLVARSEDALRDICAEAVMKGVKARYSAVDLRNHDELTDFCKELRANLTGVDCLFCNAGKSIHRSTIEAQNRLHDYDRTMDLNYRSMVAICLALFPLLVVRRGCVVYTSSVSTLFPPAPEWSAYHASKTAANVWMETANAEWAKYGVKVKIAYMPLVRTPMSDATPAYRKMPAMSADEAARKLMSLCGSRRMTYKPWWVCITSPMARAAAPLARWGYRRLGMWRFCGTLGAFAWHLFGECMQSDGDGVTLMSLLGFASKREPEKVSFIAGEERYTYAELYAKARQWAMHLHETYGVVRKSRVGLICRNDVGTTLIMIALSRLGADVKLLSSDLPAAERERMKENGKVDVLLDAESMELSQHYAFELPHVSRGGSITVMTGGSGGRYKEASRRSGIMPFLSPLTALVRDIHVQDYDGVLLALPYYHGFGLATLVVAMALCKKICLMGKFDAEEALQMIDREHLEILPVVPALLSRIWQTEGAEERMKEVKCVICGGDRLERSLVDVTNRRSSALLYNLYGTSEAGFFMLATPSDLALGNEAAVGRPIRGVRCEMRDIDADGVGTLWVKSKWAMAGCENRWQCTGDRVWRSSEGLYYYRGRTDNMVVCGGENVYPDNVERVLSEHPDVVNSQVYPAPHPDFGTVLHALIELKEGSLVTESDIRAWLHPRVSRAEMPHRIELGTVHLMENGKKVKGHY